MDKYTIRPAVMADIERIQQLSQELFEYEKRNSTKEYMFNMNWTLTQDGYNNYKSNIENDWIFVACVDEEIIGYMTCWINKKRPWLEYSVMEVGNIYIQEPYRKMGIGTELINKAKKLCKDNNIKYLKIDVLEDNKKAQEFYHKNGLYNYLIEQYVEV